MSGLLLDTTVQPASVAEFRARIRDCEGLTPLEQALVIRGLARNHRGRLFPVVKGGVPNTAPVFTLTPNVGAVNVTAANVKSDGTGTVATDIFKAFTAGANGSFVTRARFSPVATTAGTATTATVGRIFYSTTGSGATTGGTNTWLLGEVTLASVTADSTSAPTSPLEVMLNMAIPTGSFIHATTHAAPAANTSWQVAVFGGDY